MPQASLCAKCGQRYRSPLHHCTPSKVAKHNRQLAKYGKYLKP